jgi:hypothetical protein
MKSLSSSYERLFVIGLFVGAACGAALVAIARATEPPRPTQPPVGLELHASPEAYKQAQAIADSTVQAIVTGINNVQTST